MTICYCAIPQVLSIPTCGKKQQSRYTSYSPGSCTTSELCTTALYSQVSNVSRSRGRYSRCYPVSQGVPDRAVRVVAIFFRYFSKSGLQNRLVWRCFEVFLTGIRKIKIRPLESISLCIFNKFSMLCVITVRYPPVSSK